MAAWTTNHFVSRLNHTTSINKPYSACAEEEWRCDKSLTRFPGDVSKFYKTVSRATDRAPRHLRVTRCLNFHQPERTRGGHSRRAASTQLARTKSVAENSGASIGACGMWATARRIGGLTGRRPRHSRCRNRQGIRLHGPKRGRRYDDRVGVTAAQRRVSPGNVGHAPE